ncbi:MAG TPA: hypothetical protein VE988_23875, partial [Gemmataceae bacterium]|nr:hypothetical protein [Gemmataceae bacterium]
AAGNGEVEVYEKDGVKLATREFTLTRGGVTTVRVTSPGKTPAAPTGTKGTDLLANSGAKAVAWLQEQTVFGPDSEVVKDATTHIATARTLGHGIIVKLGPGLIKSQKQTWLCVRAGGFFVFELTPEQDKNSAIRERGLVTDQTEGDDAPRRDPPAATVLSLKLDQATALPADEQATGKVSFKVSEKCEGHFALRFSIQVEDLHHTRYCQLDRLENDAVDFSFPALKKGTGTAVMFVDVVSFAGADRSGPVTVRSNAIAQLVHIGPSKGEKK